MNENIKQNPNHIIQAFPTNKIVEFLTERNIKISTIELTNPKPKSVERIYTDILISLNISLESKNSQLNLFHTLKNLLKSIGTENFRFSDIFSPSSHKFPFYLSQLLNFIMHKESLKYNFEEINEKIDNLNNQKLSLNEKIKEKEKILKSINVQEEQNKEDMVLFNNEIEELKNIVQNRKNELASVMIEYKKIKSERDSFLTKNSENKMLLINLKKERELLNSQIVVDKNIFKDLETIKNAYPQEIKEIEKINKNIEDIEKSCIKIEEQGLELKRIFISFNQIDEMEKNLHDLKHEKIDLQMKNNNLQREMSFLKSQKVTYDNLIFEVQKENDKLKENSKKFSKDFKKLMHELRSDLTVQKEKKRDWKEEKNKMYEEIMDLKNKISDRHNSLNKFINEKEEEMRSIENFLEEINLKNFGENEKKN